MLRIKYFEEFKAGQPFVVVISDRQGFEKAYEFFSQKSGAALNDDAISEFSDIGPLDDSALFLTAEECRNISVLFLDIIADEVPNHSYFDSEALGDEAEIIISYKEYDNPF